MLHSSQASSLPSYFHMSSDPHNNVLAHANAVAALALLREILALPPVAGTPPFAVHSRHVKPRKPKPGNEIAPSSFRPFVSARDHLRLWHTPHSDSFRTSVLEDLPVEDVIRLFNVMLISVEPKTRENYGAGLLRFHQFCDSRNIPEHRRMPAPDHLLASFIASWAGKVAATTAQNWMAGLHFWHNLHGAPWHRHGLLRTATAGLSKVIPDSSKRPRRPPVTLEHMHALFRKLDFSNAFDSAVFATASIAFWCCCRFALLLTSYFLSHND
jgi:hypothetical protein